MYKLNFLPHSPSNTDTEMYPQNDSPLYVYLQSLFTALISLHEYGSLFLYHRCFLNIMYAQ